MGGCILSFGVNGSEAATLSLTCSEGRLPADWALVKGEGAATRCLCHKRGRQHEEVPTRESGHPVTQTPNSIIKQKQSESDC